MRDLARLTSGGLLTLAALGLGCGAAQAQGQHGYIQFAQQDSGVPGSYAAQLEVRISQLEEQMRNLTGMIEQLQYQNQQLSDRVDRAMNDLQFRVESLEGGGGQAAADGAAPPVQPAQPAGQQQAANPPPVQPQPAIGQPQSKPPSDSSLEVLTRPSFPDSGQAATLTLPQGDPAAEYNYAYSLLERMDYAGAEQALRQFLEQHPTDPLASNAQYWLGETYYVRGRFSDAATAFARSYQQFPQGAKAPDSLLKLGMSLGALGQRTDACLSFAQLQREFPTAAGALLRRGQQESERLQCG